MTAGGQPELRMIPVSRIEVLNPRDRNQQVFDEIVENIQNIGLKKPITVTPRIGDDGAEKYLLVCGEGRVKAYRKLGEERIPALVVTASDDDAFLMSLAENIARRRYKPLELLSGIAQLRDKGYKAREIAQKVGLGVSYVEDVLTLLNCGEERLLSAVCSGAIPMRAAITIAGAGDDNKAIQAALHDAYESGQLRGHQLMNARRLVLRRQSAGKGLRRAPSSSPNAAITSSSLVRAYQKEVQRQRFLVRRATVAQQRLAFVIGALRQLAADENFCNLLRAEGLDTVPKYLADHIVRG
ncbi:MULTISPECIES: ParB/RepB/Spo0J family partition protein [unclassified Variovorax]|uniref:ParB/RepB/Spo0J family partition protein n=1 Tax=unclassified Variovorax TaxID=663243 RepID=UPI00076BF9A9|nr:MULTISPECIES: ParB/RepB/Spo0J family partition protein [unclassified Variovorax]KWT73966.1 Chromosome (plasmid) partitioning protein ParB [Variovorax sp. WDL1]PNG52303.1 putative chromosome-partitioning protein ParB [Variovorax sp. B4]PNG54843.1 putative chromosome-partitioning protein ParB [Variovorax sp. B2]VTV15854.1 putative chromosome-partitioning protein ParB [Variovorax sp. WDL1]